MQNFCQLFEFILGRNFMMFYFYLLAITIYSSNRCFARNIAAIRYNEVYKNLFFIARSVTINQHSQYSSNSCMHSKKVCSTYDLTRDSRYRNKILLSNHCLEVIVEIQAMYTYIQAVSKSFSGN